MALPANFNHNLLRLSVRCPSCASVYDWQRLKILGERDQQLLAYIDCTTCGTALLSILSMQPSGLSAQGLVTDLSVEEILMLENFESLNPDDILDFHQLLENDQVPVKP